MLCGPFMQCSHEAGSLCCLVTHHVYIRGVPVTPEAQGEWTHHLPQPLPPEPSPWGYGTWGHRLPGHCVCVRDVGRLEGAQGASGGRLPLRKLVQLICGLLYMEVLFQYKVYLKNVNETFSG